MRKFLMVAAVVCFVLVAVVITVICFELARLDANPRELFAMKPILLTMFRAGGLAVLGIFACALGLWWLERRETERWLRDLENGR